MICEITQGLQILWTKFNTNNFTLQCSHCSKFVNLSQTLYETKLRSLLWPPNQSLCYIFYEDNNCFDNNSFFLFLNQSTGCKAYQNIWEIVEFVDLLKDWLTFRKFWMLAPNVHAYQTPLGVIALHIIWNHFR